MTYDQYVCCLMAAAEEPPFESVLALYIIHQQSSNDGLLNDTEVWMLDEMYCALRSYAMGLTKELF